MVYFRREFTVDKHVVYACAAFTADDYGELYCNGQCVVSREEAEGWKKICVKDVTEWIYDTLIGIKADETAPGFSHFILRPACGGALTYAQGSYLSVSGLIQSAWNAEDDVMTAYRCAVPANTTATLYLPAQSVDDLTESGKSLTDAEGITVVSSDGGMVELLLNSGVYDFRISKP